MQKYIMISQPMAGLDKDTIIHNREEAIQCAEKHGYTVLDSVFDFEQFIPKGIKNKSVYYLANSIECMSRADAVYFLRGWQSARGCRIEHEIAKEYGIKTIYEDFNDNIEEDKMINDPKDAVVDLSKLKKQPKKILYAVRDVRTGKLVSNLTSKHKKYWEKYPSVIEAIERHGKWYGKDKLEPVAFELKEIPLEK